MIVLLIAALAIAALLAGGAVIVRSHARERERQRREDVRRTRLAAVVAAESRAEEARHRAALEASDAITSVLPAIRLPPARHPLDGVRDDDSYPSLRDYPGFPAAVPFQARQEPAWYRDERPAPYADADHGANGQSEYPADRAAPGHPAERTGPGYPAGRGTPGYPAELSTPAGHPADGTAPGRWPNEPPGPATGLAEPSTPTDHPRRRAGPGSHRGGHTKRHRG